MVFGAALVGIGRALAAVWWVPARVAGWRDPVSIPVGGNQTDLLACLDPPG